MATIAIIGSGMMGSALAFPARENGNTVRIVGTPLDREIIDECRRTNRHPKFAKHFPKGIPPFPEGCEFYQIEEMMDAIDGADFVIGGVSSFGVDWFGEEVLPKLPPELPVLSVTKGLFDVDGNSPLGVRASRPFTETKLLTYPEVWKARLAEKGILRKEAMYRPIKSGRMSKASVFVMSTAASRRRSTVRLLRRTSVSSSATR